MHAVVACYDIFERCMLWPFLSSHHCLFRNRRAGSAKAGQDFVDAEGVLTFAAGERHARICVALLPNDAWSHDVNFEVVLSGLSTTSIDGGKPQKACITIPTTRVWIINVDCFPAGCPESPTPEYLMYSFFLERCAARGVKVRNTVWCYVYKAFFDCVVQSITMVYIVEAAIIADRFAEHRDDVSTSQASLESVHLLLCA